MQPRSTMIDSPLARAARFNVRAESSRGKPLKLTAVYERAPEGCQSDRLGLRALCLRIPRHSAATIG